MTFSSFSAVLAEMRSIYPGIAQYCGKSHVNVDSDDTVREVIDKFFSNPSITDRIDHKTLDRFVPKLLHSDPKIQRQFVNTYILETSKGQVERFVAHTEGLGRVLTSPLITDKIIQFHGVTKDTVNSKYLMVMYSAMIHDLRVKEDFLDFFSFNGAEDLPEQIEDIGALHGKGIKDSEHSKDNNLLLMRLEEITNAYLQRNFPETLTGEEYPLTIDQIAERVNPEADFNDGQIVLDMLINEIVHGQGSAINVTAELKRAYEGKVTVNGNTITLQSNLSKNEVNEFLEKFIDENRPSLSTLTHLVLFNRELNNRELKTLPRAIKRLNVRSLSVVNSAPQFKLPRWIGDLTNLRDLDLSNNQLSGPIQPKLGDLTNLRKLNLSDNQLSGPIPPELGHLTNLRKLNLSNNQLSGSIPPEIGALPNLKNLNLYRNQLTGSIPSELGALTDLETLSLSDNQLSGPIPPNIQDLIDRGVADLEGNPDLQS